MSHNFKVMISGSALTALHRALGYNPLARLHCMRRAKCGVAGGSLGRSWITDPTTAAGWAVMGALQHKQAGGAAGGAADGAPGVGGGGSGGGLGHFTKASRTMGPRARPRFPSCSLLTHVALNGVVSTAPHAKRAYHETRLLHTENRDTSSRMSDPKVTAKRLAGYKAIDEYLDPQFSCVGIGSGSTVVYCVERIAQLVEEGKLDASRMTFVPTGFQSKMLITEANLTVKEVDQLAEGEVDIVFDGADEIDSDLNCIKGGGACLFQEKLVGMTAKKFVIVADDSKVSQRLGERWKQGVPIEIVPPATRKVSVDLEKLGAKTITLRMGGKAKAGPVITDNSNFILDTYFGEIDQAQVKELAAKIKLLVGVVEVGLFDYAEAAYIGNSDGSVKKLAK